MVSPPQHFKMLYLIYAWFKVCMCKSTNCICFVALKKLPRHKFAWFCLIEKHAQYQNSKRINEKWKIETKKERKKNCTHSYTNSEAILGMQLLFKLHFICNLVVIDLVQVAMSIRHIVYFFIFLFFYFVMKLSPCSWVLCRFRRVNNLFLHFVLCVYLFGLGTM